MTAKDCQGRITFHSSKLPSPLRPRGVPTGAFDQAHLNSQPMMAAFGQCWIRCLAPLVAPKAKSLAGHHKKLHQPLIIIEGRTRFRRNRNDQDECE